MSARKSRLPKGTQEITSPEPTGQYIPDGHRPPEPDRPTTEPSPDQDRLVMTSVKDFPHVANLRCPYCGRQRFTRIVDKIHHEEDENGVKKRVVEEVEKDYTIRRGVAVTERLNIGEVPGRLRLYCRDCLDDDGNRVLAERTDVLAVREVTRPEPDRKPTETKKDD